VLYANNTGKHDSQIPVHWHSVKQAQ